MTIRRSDYLCKPQVWGDERPDGALEVQKKVEDVEVGDLVVFTGDHSNAYEVRSIDHLTLLEGTPNAFPFVRFKDPTPQAFEFGTGTLGGHALDDRADLVLDSIVADASTYRRSESFEDFADEFGINADSRSELALYEAMGDAAARLAEFVGGDAELENLIYNVERP